VTFVTEPDPASEPTVEDVHHLALACVRGYSPTAPAEDIAQDVVERWLMQDPKPTAWRGWVRTVARNRVSDLMASDRGGREVPYDGTSDGYIALAGALFGPSGQTIARMRIGTLLGDLPPAECRVVLASLEGWSNAEIAAEFGYANSATVATVLARAKAKIRQASPNVRFELHDQRMYDI
jgi:DNA-directed RNA polymerase specialized sigma24 family protein